MRPPVNIEDNNIILDGESVGLGRIEQLNSKDDDLHEQKNMHIQTGRICIPDLNNKSRSYVWMFCHLTDE